MDEWPAGYKVTNPVWPNETVIARGVMTGPLQDEKEEPERTGAFVWLAKPDQTVVLVATASVRSI